jgi:hypothetical protein
MTNAPLPHHAPVRASPAAEPARVEPDRATTAGLSPEQLSAAAKVIAAEVSKVQGRQKLPAN